MSNGDSVRIENVNKTFKTRHFFKKNDTTGKREFFSERLVHAVKNVDFCIGRGEVFGLLGPNGAGKTTTIKMISGLIRPSSGHVYVDSLHVEKKRRQVLGRIGVVLEGTRTCIWPLTPMENLAYFGRLKDVSGKILKERSAQLLEFIGLKEKMDVEVRRLSRGQKQKLAICIALIADPPVILLDEPTTGLDVQSSRAIKDKIREMAREHNKTVLVTTHDMFTAQEICDRIGIISQGELVACKPTAELLDLFADLTLEIRLNAAPDPKRLLQVPGVAGVDTSPFESSILCTVRLDGTTEGRSNALYGVMDSMREQGLTLLSLTQKQQSLESVFLKLTTTSR
jgi:ABC-2 type transport system ATP-binding protein